MKHIFLFVFLLPNLLLAQPSIEWSKCYGGMKNDFPGALIPAADGGYIMTGMTQSSDGDVTANHGNYDLWVVKLRANGSIEWQKTYGGSADDAGSSIIQVFDGGYIIAGSTASIDGDLKGIRTSDSSSSVWILKIDSIGNIQWQKTFGGSIGDGAVQIINGGEGELIVLGITESGDGDIHNYHGNVDISLFALSTSGLLKWEQTYGGSNDDEANAIIRTSDGGYAIAGYTYSTDGDATARKRDTTGDVWLVKVNAIGNIEWQKTYGGSGFEDANGIIENSDGSFTLAGFTTSKDGDVSFLHSNYYADVWIVGADKIGNILWEKTYGGSNGEIGYSIIRSPDLGYYIAANTTSVDGDVTGLHGSTDCWIFKISRTGKLLWQKTLGGSSDEAATSPYALIVPSLDSGVLVATLTKSSDGDVTARKGDSSKDWDIWLAALTPEKAGVDNSPTGNSSPALYPNPTKGSTSISYFLDAPSRVTIEIYNPLGEKLRTLVDANQDSGNHEQEFDLSGLPSGLYLLRIELNGETQMRKIELIK
jgi:hypothetical protein